MVPFSLLWGGFAIFWLASALIGGAPLPFALFGVPFVLMGLHMIFGRFIVDRRERAKTYYGLTDSRVIIVGGLFSRSVTSLALRTLSECPSWKLETVAERSPLVPVVQQQHGRVLHGQALEVRPRPVLSSSLTQGKSTIRSSALRKRRPANKAIERTAQWLREGMRYFGVCRLRQRHRRAAAHRSVMRIRARQKVSRHCGVSFSSF